jgi:tetratricopeptide (TPR) repeat protein
MFRLAVILALCSTAWADAPPSPLAEAQEKLRLAGRERDKTRRDRLVADVVEVGRKLAAKQPTDAEPHFLLGRALSVADPQQPELCPTSCDQAIAELEQARKLDNDGPLAEKLASELGTVLSRLNRHEGALIEYERALRRVDGERLFDPGHVVGNADERASLSVLYGNSAETLMALGRLEAAIARYRLASDTGEVGSLEWELAQWGLAVALDRDDQEEGARQAARRALERDPTLVRLRSDGVFFEPLGDKFYYFALGHEAAGDRQAAMDAWKSYLAATPHPRWAPRARAHLDALKKQKGGAEPPATVAFGEPETFIGLRTLEDLRSSLREHEDEIRLCYQRALRERPGARGDFFLTIDILPSGHAFPPPRVFQMRFDRPADADSVGGDLRRCVEITASSWHFSAVERLGMSPAPPENVMVRILFGPQK